MRYLGTDLMPSLTSSPTLFLNRLINNCAKTAKLGPSRASTTTRNCLTRKSYGFPWGQAGLWIWFTWISCFGLGVTYRHYAHRDPLAFKVITTIPQPPEFLSLVKGMDGECPNWRRSIRSSHCESATATSCYVLLPHRAAFDRQT